MSVTDWGEFAAERLAEIARASEPGAGVTRLPFTPEHRAALDLITAWMEDAGMRVRLDPAGTLVGRLDGAPGAMADKTFLMGSHQDSVRHGGGFDGIMGVALPILAIKRLRAAKVTLPFAVEVLAFADEEGVRFPTALVGSRAIAGSFDPAVLALADRGGESLREAMADFGLDPEKTSALARDPASVLGFLETHIEQGPVLEDANQALGIVTAICGIERHEITLTGQSGHAGTLPMATRRDALVGAAAIISQAHRLGCDTPDLRATIGELHVAPNAVNAVPGEVRMTLELRAPDDAVRDRAGRALTAFAHEQAQAFGLTLDMRRTYRQRAQACDATMMARLSEAVQATGNAGLTLPSGATHDASAMADLCPVAMLFVRCLDGKSHVPEEFANAQDLGSAVAAISGFLVALGQPSG